MTRYNFLRSFSNFLFIYQMIIKMLEVATWFLSCNLYHSVVILRAIKRELIHNKIFHLKIPNNSSNRILLNSCKINVLNNVHPFTLKTAYRKLILKVVVRSGENFIFYLRLYCVVLWKYFIYEAVKCPLCNLFSNQNQKRFTVIYKEMEI